MRWGGFPFNLNADSRKVNTGSRKERKSVHV
jgi:hypothetical protein